MMIIDKITHPELKNYINLIYMQGENQNQNAINKLEIEIKKPVKIPYGSDGEYVVPIFTDKREYTLGMQYFSLNVMDKNKEYIIEKLDYFKNLKEDPNFLGYLVNISSVSYIINTSLL